MIPIVWRSLSPDKPLTPYSIYQRKPAPLTVNSSLVRFLPLYYLFVFLRPVWRWVWRWPLTFSKFQMPGSIGWGACWSLYLVTCTTFIPLTFQAFEALALSLDALPLGTWEWFNSQLSCACVVINNPPWSANMLHVCIICSTFPLETPANDWRETSLWWWRKDRQWSGR